MMIKLTMIDGTPLRINPFQVISIYPYADGETTVETTGRNFRVKETVEEIDAQLGE